LYGRAAVVAVAGRCPMSWKAIKADALLSELMDKGVLVACLTEDELDEIVTEIVHESVAEERTDEGAV
jgi:hypothetical protein